MAKKGNLFFLIKSLDKSEKRYFKRFCFNQKVNNNYLRLFDAYDAQKEFDDQAIRMKFKGESFVRQLHVTKNYLNQLILRSLRNYHQNISRQGELKDLLRNIEILFQKELFDQCEYEIQKAEKLARQFELFKDLLSVMGWKRRLLLAREGLQEAKLSALVEEEKAVLQKQMRVNEYWGLTAKTFSFIGDKSGRLLQEDCIQHPEDHASLQGQILYHHLMYSYYTFNNRPVEGLEMLDRLITIIEAKPDRIKDDPGPYVTALNNKISYYLFQKQYDQAIELLQKIKAVPDIYGLEKESQFTIKLHLRSYNVELEVYRDTFQLEKGKKLIEEVAGLYLEQREKETPPVYAHQLWYQFAYIYFMLNEFSSALRWVNKIVNTPYKDTRPDLQSYARLLNLMIHFEMGNIFVLKYAVDSCRRFLRKKDRIEVFEKVLLRFFSQISNAPEADYHHHFKKLHASLFDVDPPLMDDNQLDYLHVRRWIEGKV